MLKGFITVGNHSFAGLVSTEISIRIEGYPEVDCFDSSVTEAKRFYKAHYHLDRRHVKWEVTMTKTLDDILEYVNEHTDVHMKLYTEDTQPYIECEFSSQLGEDCIVTICLENESVGSFFEALDNHCRDYAGICEEELEFYIRERPRGTENFSVRELVDDADWKVDFWKTFVSELKHLV